MRRRAGSDSSSSRPRPACSPRATSRLIAAVIRPSSRRRRAAAAPVQRAASPDDLVHRLARGRGALGRPAPLGRALQHDRGIVDLAERLIGQACDRCLRIGPGDLVCRRTVGAGEATDDLQPLRLHRGVGHQHQRRHAETPRHLHAQQGLARPRGRHDMGVAAAGLPVPLERLQRGLLVLPPRSPERQRRQRRFHRSPGHRALPVPHPAPRNRANHTARRAGRPWDAVSTTRPLASSV